MLPKYQADKFIENNLSEAEISGAVSKKIKPAFEEQDDNSTLLEFDEITNKKILDELVKLVFVRNNDPRVQGHIQVNTINPLQDTLQEVR